MSESFRLDQPRANDLVGNPLLIAGSGGGFEATIAVRVLDGNGQVGRNLRHQYESDLWQTSVSLPEPPPPTEGSFRWVRAPAPTRHPGCLCRCSTAPP